MANEKGYSFLRPTEQIRMEGGANKTAFAGANVGGKLILTNERLLFKHTLGSTVEEINLNDIFFSGDDFNILIPSKNMIKIMTKQGQDYQFLVSGKDKDRWESELGQIVRNVLNGVDNVQPTANVQQQTPYYNQNNTAQYNGYAGGQSGTTQKKARNWKKICIIAGCIFLVLLVFAQIGRRGGVSDDILENAEKTVSDTVESEVGEVPEKIGAECVYKGDKHAIIKVYYRTAIADDGTYYEGTIFVKANISTEAIYEEYYYFEEYDRDLNEKELDYLIDELQID